MKKCQVSYSVVIVVKIDSYTIWQLLLDCFPTELIIILKINLLRKPYQLQLAKK